MVHANLLFLMTDVDCLYDKNPRKHADAKPIEVVDDIAALEADGEFSPFASPPPPPFSLVSWCFADREEVTSAGSSVGTGGMITKIIAAKLGTSAGVTTIITRSSNPGNILNIIRYLQVPENSCVASVTNGSTSAASKGHSPKTSPENSPQRSPDVHVEALNLDAPSTVLNEPSAPPLHTRFIPSSDPIADRYFWLLHTPHPQGTLFIDHGAHRALVDKAGLLPVGVVDVEGNFAQHEVVSLVVVTRRPSPGPEGRHWEGIPQEVGRALVNYAAPEIHRIRGCQSAEIEGILGYADSEYVAHRSHIGLFRPESRPVTPVREISQLTL